MVRPNAFAMRLAAAVWLGVALLLVGCNKSDSSSGAPIPQKVVGVKPPTVYIWEPNPAWLPDMTQVGDLGKYQVSLMKDFTPAEIKRKLPDNIKIKSWKGPAEAGQAQPVLTFTVWYDDKQIQKEVNQGIRKVLINLTAGMTDSAGITATRPGAEETGTIGGIGFSRAKWIGQANDGVKNVPVEGITYAGVDGPNVISIIATSFGKDAEKSNQLLVSTIATLKKQ